jgi:hypothetical protein
MIPHRHDAAALDRRGVAWGLVGVAVTLAITFVGSDGLLWFDAALIGYLFGIIFMVFGVIYRYSVWVRRPSTAMLNRRGWDAFRQRKARNAAALPSLVATQLLAQGFIRRRSRARWLAHQLVFWGCILAGLVTFPLTLGLLHFESVGQQGDRYQVYFSRVGTLKLRCRQHVIGWTIYHALDIAAVLVLAGVFIFLRRRLRDPGALATERSGDFLALAGLFAVSVTGSVPDRVEHLARGPLLCGAEHAACADGDPRVDVHPVRQAVPHLPAASQSRRHVLQAGERRRPGRCLSSVWRRVRERATDRRSARCSCRSSGSTTIRRRRSRQLPGHVPEVPPRSGGVGAIGACGRVRLMARPPMSMPS